MNNNEYGVLLREVREKKKLTIEQVSKDTKIMTKVIQALESMDKDSFVSDAYHQGFLKLYTKYLGIKEETIMNMLAITNMQEKAVEFDVINIQSGNRKRLIRIITILIIVFVIIGVGVFFGLGGHIALRDMLGKQAQKREVHVEQNLESIQGFVEKRFLLGNRKRLVSDNVHAIVEIASINPPRLVVDNKNIALKLNTPYKLDINEDGSAEYIVLVRVIDISKNQLLIRFDPNVQQSNVEELLNKNEPTIIPDGDIIDVETSFNRKQIQVLLNFNNYSYYKISNDNNIIQESTTNAGDRKELTTNEAINVYIANDAFVEIFVNGKKLEYKTSGLPKVFYIVWNKKDDGYILQAIPLP